MRIACSCRFLALLILATPILASAKSPAQADPWLLLNRITHKRGYTIETRDHRCVEVTITNVTNDHLAAEVSRSSSLSFSGLTFPRADVLRVTAWRSVYYSGRSSWSDISSLRLAVREELQQGLKIVMKDGKVYRAKHPQSVSDEGITLHVSGKPVNLSKGDIAQVYYVLAKPLSGFAEYSLDELGPMVIFDPDWYAWKLHLEHHVAVLLYDASRPEDNSPAQCVAK